MTSDLSMFDLNGRVAFVTGGAAGIGRTAALALARAGADVAIVDLDEGKGNETVAAITDLGRRSIYVRCDVSNEDQVNAMVEAVVEKLGRLDIAVNNAGIFIRGRDEDSSKAEWDKVININLTGTWLCAQAAMRQMKQQVPAEGKIINIGSLGAITACSNGSYDASKAAVMHLSKNLASQWGRYNINVNCISPGYVTPVFGKERSPEECARLKEVTPLGHVQRTDDLSGAIVFMASRASDYITGQNLMVDGGHSISTWLNPLDTSFPSRKDFVS